MEYHFEKRLCSMQLEKPDSLKYSRRSFLLHSGVVLWPLSTCFGAASAEDSFRADDSSGGFLNVRRCGAKGDGQTNDTEAIQSAIERTGSVGGTIVFPPGRYRAGTLRLRNNLTIHLTAGATLLASPDDADFEPYEELLYSTYADRETSDFGFALLRGRDLENISIVGPGRIDGNRSKRGGPKPIALKNCHRVLIRDLTLVNSPNYNISLLGCDDVDILGVRILNGYCDGIDPDCCQRVRISNCLVECWDDAIVPKASYALGHRRSTENVTVTNCVLSTACNAFKLGTESSGDFKNIVVSNCTVYGQPEKWKRNPISGVSLEMVDGGTLERVAISNIAMTGARVPLYVRLANRGRSQTKPTPHNLQRILISDIVATGAALTSSITGIPGYPVRGISLKNIRLTAHGGGHAELASRTVPELEKEYPDGDKFGELPAYGLYCRHVENLVLDDVHLDLETPDARPAFVLEDVSGADLRLITAAPPQGGSPVWAMQAVQECYLQGSRALPGTRAYLKLGGSQSARVHLAGNDLSAALKPYVVAADVPATCFRHEGNLLPQRY